MFGDEWQLIELLGTFMAKAPSITLRIISLSGWKWEGEDRILLYEGLSLIFSYMGLA